MIDFPAPLTAPDCAKMGPVLVRPGAFSLLFRMHTTSLGFDDVSDLSLRNSTKYSAPFGVWQSVSVFSSSANLSRLDP